MGVRYDLAIVGGGPAGCSAAVMAASLGISSVVLDPAGVGGRLRLVSWIDNLLGQQAPGPELAARWEGHVRAAGVPVMAEEVVAVKVVEDGWSLSTAGGGVVEADGLVVAAGTRNRRLAEHPLVAGVAPAHADVFLDLRAHRALLKEPDVVVIGCDRPLVTFAAGVGDARPRGRLRVVALPEKRYALDSWPADWPLDVVKASAVRSVTSPGEVVVVGDDGAVCSLAASLVVTNLGGMPNAELFVGFLARRDDGYLEAAPRRPGLPFLRAAGDVVDPDEQRVSVAIGAGAAAALDFFRTRRPR